MWNKREATNQHIRMISEDWSKDCRKFKYAITGINLIYLLKSIKQLFQMIDWLIKKNLNIAVLLYLFK